MIELIKLQLKLILQKKTFVIVMIVLALGLGFLPGKLTQNANQALKQKLNEKTLDTWKANSKQAAANTLRASEEKFKKSIKDARANIYQAGINNSLEIIMTNWIDFFGNISFPYILTITLKSTSSAIDQTGLLLWALLATPFLLPFVGCFIGMLEKQNQIQTMIITSGVGKIATLASKIFILALFSFLVTCLSIFGFYLGNGQLSLPTISQNELLTVALTLLFFGSLFVGVLAFCLSNLFKEPLTSYFLASSLLPLLFWAIVSYHLGCNSVNNTLHTLKDTALNTKVPREIISSTKFENMVEQTIYKESQLLALNINEQIIPSWVAKLNPGPSNPIHEKSIQLGMLFLALSVLFSAFSFGLINRK